LIQLTYGSTPCKVSFFENKGYSGNMLVISAGTNQDNLPQIGWNDKISSFYFTKGDQPEMMCVVHACWNTYCSDDNGGKSTDYIYGFDQPYVGDGPNDEFSAIRVYSINTSSQSYAFFKKECDYTGYGWLVTPQQLNNNQNIFAGDLSTHHIGNDQLSRVVTGPLSAVNLYQDDNYQGKNLLLSVSGDTQCLTGSSFNDLTSSVRYYDLSNGGAFPKPDGSWVIQTSNGYNQPLLWVLHYGYTTSDSRSTTSTFGTEISTSIKAGTEFDGVSVSATVSSSISKFVSTDITRSTDITCTGSCAANTCSSGIQYLWSWQMKFTRPWDTNPSTSLDSCNWLCTCSSIPPPACPLTACMDVQCTQCYSYTG